MKTYTARAERSGKWWSVVIPEIPGVFTQARRLDQVEDQVRDAIALFLNVAPTSFGVSIQAHVPALDPLIEQARKVRHEAERQAVEAHDVTRRTVRELRQQAELPVRDIGALLGVSYQRVQQLAPVKAAAKKTTSRRAARVVPTRATPVRRAAKVAKAKARSGKRR